MMLKNLYNEAENEKKNKIKEKQVHTMSLDEYISEHQELIKVLREGSRDELLVMAKKQEEELGECLKENGMPDEEND